MKKVIGFGDFLVRLSPPGYQRFIQCSQFDINYTGAEANVCVSLAMMGIETEFVTRLPDNDIAKAGLSMMRKYSVGVNHVAFGGDRMGVFYLEKGASQRPGKVVYDRQPLPRQSRKILTGTLFLKMLPGCTSLESPPP